MRKLFSFIKKEFRHIIRDKRTLLIVFAMPVALVLLFGFAITTEIKDAKIAILDNSHDQMSTQIVDKMTSSGYFIADKFVATNDDLPRVFADGRIKLAIVFPPNFAYDYHHQGNAQIQLIADASDLNTATQLINYATSIINDYQVELQKSPKNVGLFDTTVKMLYNPEQKSVYMFVPGVLALIMAIISAMMTAVSIAKEKESGTMRVLTVSPLNTITIIIGKVLPYLIISFISTILILILAVWVFEMPINGSLSLLLLVCLIFLFTSMAMGILIASFVKNQQLAAIISIVGLFLPIALLSGFIYPIENMPAFLQVICHCFPAKWFIEAIKGVMIKGVGFSYVWLQIVVMLGMTALFLTISIKRFNKKVS